MSEIPHAAPRRSPGRPRRISHEQILAAAVRILEGDGLPAFTMATLAKSVGASVMALYTYFSSRSALLDAVADHIFATFEAPPDGLGWEETLRTWIAGLKRGFEQRPVAWQLVRWDAHVAPAWLKVWTPMSHALVAAGLEDERLLFACRWLSSAAMGAINGVLSAAPGSAVSALVGRAGLSEADDARLAALAKLYDPAQRQAVFDFEVEAMVRTLGELIERRVAVPPPGERPAPFV